MGDWGLLVSLCPRLLVEKPKRREDFQMRSKVGHNLFTANMNIGFNNTFSNIKILLVNLILLIMEL